MKGIGMYFRSVIVELVPSRSLSSWGSWILKQYPNLPSCQFLFLIACFALSIVVWACRSIPISVMNLTTRNHFFLIAITCLTFHWLDVPLLPTTLPLLTGSMVVGMEMDVPAIRMVILTKENSSLVTNMAEVYTTGMMDESTMENLMKTRYTARYACPI
jgi:hypothetical protein